MTVILHIRALEPTTVTERVTHEVMDRWELPDKDYPHTYVMGAQPNKSELRMLDEGNALVGAFWAACGLAGCGVILAVGYFVFDAIRHLL